MINAGFLFSELFLWYLCGRKILSCLQCHRQKIGTRMFGLHCQILSTAMWAESTRWYWYLYLYFQGLKKGFFFYISLTPVKIILLSFFHISKFAVSTLCMSRLSFNHCFSDFHIHQTKCVRLVHDILSWERAGQPYQSSHQNNVFLGFLDF